MKAYQIKFKGPEVVDRILTSADFPKDKGIVFPTQMRWNRENDHTVTLPEGELHETARDWFKTGPEKDDFAVKEVDLPDDFFGAPAAPKPDKP